MSLYKDLGVSSSATQEEIKRAYRVIAMRDHPDRNPNNEEANSRFVQANKAYEILSDGEKRKSYDSELVNKLVSNISHAAQEHWSRFINETLQGE